MSDLNVYLHAATNIRQGISPYTAPADPTVHNVYRYAPWFAALWVPFTYLPVEVVRVGWSVVLLSAAAAAVLPYVRYGTAGILLALLMGPILYAISGSGNVQPLLIAALVHGIDRRSGPVVIAMAASLKFVPLAFVLVYVSRRQWGRVTVTLVATLILVAPMLLFDLPGFTVAPPDSLYAMAPVAWLAVACAAALVAVWLAAIRSRYVDVAAAFAAVVALPRLLLYDVSFILPAARPTALHGVPKRAQLGRPQIE